MKKKNKFRLGDNVSVVDEAIEGVVKKIRLGAVTIETSDGFLYDFLESELVKETAVESLSRLGEAYEPKEADNTPSKKKSLRKKALKKQAVMEVDLHIHQLLTTTKGMTNYDMLTLQIDTARRYLERAMRTHISRIVFIHGVGQGVLREELEYMLSRYDNVDYYDADFQRYGLGATEVYIYQKAIR